MTEWSVVRGAHAGAPEEVLSAQEQLLDRYGGAARRYLLAAVRDQHAADELFQEFALRFVRGDFRRADPERGRFRSFLKTALYHLVIDYQRRHRRGPETFGSGSFQPADLDPDPGLSEESFLNSWREELLSRAWGALEELERTSGGHLYTVLRLRAERPEMNSGRIAEELGARLGAPYTAGNVRQMLHRAREKFAEFLVHEIAQSLEEPTADEIEDELIDLNLLEYCRPAIGRYGRANPSPPTGGPAAPR
ncbi:MAG TPA: sigma-70 family RNA polymerase sigma factor [Planctomycetaceae bacterium]